MAEKKQTEEVQETATVEAPVVNEAQQNPEQFLKEFNWEKYEEGIEQVEDKKLQEFEKLVAENFVDTADEEVVDGTVVHMTDREAIIDINAKSEGVISLNEFRYNPDLKVGDKVEVLIDVREDKTGQLVLSHRKARTIKAWDRVNAAHDTGEIVNGFVKCRTKGGMIVDVFGIEAFLPGSQIDVKPIRDYDQYRLSKQISKSRKKKLSVSLKKVKYWKVQLRILLLTVYLSILVVLTDLFILLIFLGAVSTIRMRSLSLTRN